MNPKLNNDWGYAMARMTNDGCGDFTCDVLLRDGMDDNPCCAGDAGYGFPDWTP